MELLNDLSKDDRSELERYPVYLSLLAANLDGKLDDRKKNIAAELMDIKTYNETNPRLKQFFQDAAGHFVHSLETLDAQLPQDKDAREQALRQQLGKVEAILHRMGPETAKAFRESMQAFKEHVSKAHENVLEHFMFPLPMKGFTDV